MSQNFKLLEHYANPAGYRRFKFGISVETRACFSQILTFHTCPDHFNLVFTLTSIIRALVAVTCVPVPLIPWAVGLVRAIAPQM